MNKKLKTRPLAQTKLNVTTLGFGAAALGNLYHEVSDEDARLTLSAAINSGMNLFDTAPRYGAGLSERRIGDALRKIPKDDYIISTKVGRILKPDVNANTNALRHGFLTPMAFEAHYDYSYDGIMRSYEDSLQRLGLAEIDMLLVHDIGRYTHGERSEYYFRQLELGGLKALQELKEGQHIKAIGLGVNEIEICERVMDVGQFDCFLLAGRYSLLEQEPIYNFFPKCEAYGASIILGGPYNSGILATGVSGDTTPYYNYQEAPQHIILKVAEIEKVCRMYDVTLAAAALQFPLGHPIISSVIPGLDNPSRVKESIELFFEYIPDEFWQTLKDKELIDIRAPILDLKRLPK
ncbi:aldo/keto reductase [Thalassotalea maritima]|uniref:aldo/keto reductase n=1 Tax=Thalassotalea maritima TaxID=3242416 RepID=UPI003526F2B4